MILLDVSFYDRFLYIFNVVVAWIMVRLHDVLIFFGMQEGPHLAWVLSIIGLTLIVRSAIIPLYAKQIRSQRAMQEIQPKMMAIREKYKGRKDQVSQQQMNQETMALYREHGVNPMASCLPILIQMPFIIALYRVLLSTGPIANGTFGWTHLGPIDQQVAQEIETTEFLGMPLSTTFATARQTGHTSWMVIIIVLALVMALIMFLSMWILSVRNLPRNSSDQNARMMKMMAFMGPIMTLTFSFVVQMGVLVYWLVTNIFSAVQQMVILAKAPTVGSPAHESFLARAQKKYDVYESKRTEEFMNDLKELGVSERELNTAYGQVLRAEDKASLKNAKQGETADEVDKKPSRFTTASAVKRQLRQEQMDYISADKTRERLGDLDPLQSDRLHQAVALKRQYELEKKHKRLDVGLEKEAIKRKPKKKGYFARKMEEAMQMQQEQQRMQAGRQGQRVQPTKQTRAQRTDTPSSRQQKRKEQVRAARDITPEELERRRQERRKQAREQAKKNRNKKK